MYLSDEEYQIINQALDDAQEMRIKYSNALKLLEEQNDFLAETIEKQNLGQITAERHDMQAKIFKLQADSDKVNKEAQGMKSEYGKKLDKITILIQDIKAKQSDIDSYIDSESDVKIADIKKSLNAEYKKKKSELECQYLQKESDCEIKVVKFKHFMVTAIIGMVIATISAFTGIKALLLLIIVDVIISILLIKRK